MQKSLPDTPQQQLTQLVCLLFNQTDNCKSYSPANDAWLQIGIHVYSPETQTALRFEATNNDAPTSTIFKQISDSIDQLAKQIQSKKLVCKRLFVITSSNEDAALQNYVQRINDFEVYPFKVFYWGWNTLARQLDTLNSIKKATPAKPDKIITSLPFYRQYQLFVSDQLLTQIHEKLWKKGGKTGVVTLWSSVAGLGKTSVALSYILQNKYASGIDYIAWVQMSGDAKLSVLRALCTAKGFEYMVHSSTTDNFHGTIEYLKQLQGRKLLIIDDFANEVQWQNIENVVSTTGCAVLNTANEPIMGTFNISLPVTVHSEQIFYTFYKGERTNNIANVIKKASAHPFLLEFLGKTLTSRANISADIMLQILSEADKRTPHLQPFTHGKAPDNEAKLQRVVLKYLLAVYEHEMKQLSRNEIKYLRYLSVLPTGDYSIERLADMFGADRQRLADVLLELIGKNWITSHNELFRMPEPIQLIVRKKLRPDEQNCQALIKYTLNVLQSQQALVTDMLYAITLAETLVARLEKRGILLTDLCTLLIGFFEHENNNLLQREYTRYKLYLLQLQLNPDEPTYANVCSQMATCLLSIGNYQQSLDYGFEALRVQTATLANNHPDIAYTCHLLAQNYYHRRDYAHAIEYIDRCLDIYKEIYASDNEALSNALQWQEHISTAYEQQQNTNSWGWLRKVWGK